MKWFQLNNDARIVEHTAYHIKYSEYIQLMSIYEAIYIFIRISFAVHYEPIKRSVWLTLRCCLNHSGFSARKCHTSFSRWTQVKNYLIAYVMCIHVRTNQKKRSMICSYFAFNTCNPTVNIWKIPNLTTQHFSPSFFGSLPVTAIFRVFNSTF